ncbi:MAG: hypothetical protein VKJ06_04995 [Vampirovibrionales bacterium]|nr:hypothetical protein [Vampirovibrionales bacterium]
MKLQQQKFGMAVKKVCVVEDNDSCLKKLTAYSKPNPDEPGPTYKIVYTHDPNSSREKLADLNYRIPLTVQSEFGVPLQIINYNNDGTNSTTPNWFNQTHNPIWTNADLNGVNKPETRKDWPQIQRRLDKDLAKIEKMIKVWHKLDKMKQMLQTFVLRSNL